MKAVYLDHAATTPMRDEVIEAMMPYFKEKFGNASSVYSFGREARKALDEARQATAGIINADFNEIIFTGGGSEANNLAIKGAAWEYRHKGKHLITSSIEHHAVLHPMQQLEKEGFEVTYLPVDDQGLVSVEEFANALRGDTILVSIMHANNEIGVIQPIAQIGAICKERGILFHTDAVQTAGLLDIDVKKLNVDMLTMSAHKLYGPKGVGALYVRKGVRLVPLIQGGGHENRRRAGTENVPGIVGMAKALELAAAEREVVTPRIQKLRDRLLEGILNIPHTRLNGSRTERLPNNINVSIEFIEGESLLLNLDLKGIAASSGSACTSGSLDPSHVLLAIGLSHEVAHGSLRLTLGRDNTDADVDYVLETLPPIVERLREMSPLFSS
ncbi:MAG: cysteine desulfurase NifS [Limnochordia bacterium]|jgi:cysteine desulfurase|nr:cysteine desulfurase NifS [Bacillota bacterium]HOB08697.1 cysteine desulfurase NifS [Limnochordia bacterium]NLH32011.1 cysteine desulfurase NifS [Bacillota bacterium]HPT92688.1 cysteine desulfurase NifS [Limnochordia bacterium]HPZ30943.1 cysteine desulfurase NifS [Limnochordia bacterium]